MRYKQRIAWLLLISLLWGTLLWQTALAAGLEDELESLRNQMDAQQTRINAAEMEVQNISEQLRVIQSEVDEAVSEYESVRAQLEATESKIEENAELLAEAEARLARQMVVLNRRMRDIYKNGQISYIDVLFGAADFDDFMTRMDLLKRIIKSDYELVMKVREERRFIVEKRAELEADRSRIGVLEQLAAERRRHVESKKQQKAVLLDKAESDRDMAERVYQELLEASRQVENMIRRSHYTGTGQSTGQMMWPIIGEITSEYGWRVHPIFGTSKYHSGMDIAGDYGMEVVAADGGTVIYADWISGYGNAVIIDHGKGISTLYGHNDSLVVSEGQNVSKGELIAYCGSTGYSTGPHVHFEVRLNGEPTDPMDYLN